MLNIVQKYWTWFKKIKPLSENFSPLWCPKLVTGLHVTFAKHVVRFTG